MKTCWTQGLSEEHAKEVRADFKGCYPTRKRLIEICQDKINTSAKVSRSKDGYASPNWAYSQADAIGFERALFDIISIISDESVEK